MVVIHCVLCTVVAVVIFVCIGLGSEVEDACVECVAAVEQRRVAPAGEGRQKRVCCALLC